MLLPPPQCQVKIQKIKDSLYIITVHQKVHDGWLASFLKRLNYFNEYQIPCSTHDSIKPTIVLQAMSSLTNRKMVALNLFVVLQV